MPWVKRAPDNSIVGIFNRKQPGYAEEQLPNDNPEVTAVLQAQADRVNAATTKHDEAKARLLSATTIIGIKAALKDLL